MQTVRIVHISDPHFGTTTASKVLALTAAVKALNPDAIALSGDISQRAHQDQFLAAKSFCKGLSEFKIIAVPGNHDLPLFNLAARALRPYFHFNHTFGFPVNSSLQMGSVQILGLNTTHPKRHVQGELYPQEISRLQTFNSHSNIRIALFHHPLDCAQSVDEKNLLISAEESLPHLEKARVDIVLSGHIHDPLARLSTVRYPYAKRPLVVAVAGTCLSSRTRSGAPNSFNLVELKFDDSKGSTTFQVDLNITRYDLNLEGNFYPLSHTRFIRDENNLWRPH